MADLTNSNQALPPGTVITNYTILKVLSRGGFGVVYLAKDDQDNSVAIKEYLPASVASRSADGITLEAYNEQVEPAFRYGMRCFFEEVRALARISHPNIVRVLNLFRANNTIYMVMTYEIGRTLQHIIADHALSGVLTESALCRIFVDLLSGVREIHGQKILHLDIKPANIYICNDGRPVLLDFGAARQVMTSDRTKISTILTPGFAAPEQFGGNRNLIGPWTDIYAIGATLYACVTRQTPQGRSIDRKMTDMLQPASEVGKGQYSPRFLAVIDQCMQVDPMGRPPSVWSLQKQMVEIAHTEFKAPARKLGWLASIKKML